MICKIEYLANIHSFLTFQKSWDRGMLPECYITFPLSIARWETLFLNCDPRPPLLVNDWAFRGCPFYTQSCLTCFQLTCSPVECSKLEFFQHSSTFPVFCCPCPSFFGTCCRHQIQNEGIFAKNTKVWTWHVLSLYCIQLNIGRKGFANHCILFLFTFYTTSQLHWNWVCRICHRSLFGNPFWPVLNIFCFTSVWENDVVCNSMCRSGGTAPYARRVFTSRSQWLFFTKNSFTPLTEKSLMLSVLMKLPLLSLTARLTPYLWDKKLGQQQVISTGKTRSFSTWYLRDTLRWFKPCNKHLWGQPRNIILS